MALPFRLHISADIDFLPVSDVPELTARGIYPLSDDEPDSQVLRRAACRMNHEQALDRAIDDGQVTILNPASYEPHTFPFGAARQEAVMTVDDFKRFAQSLQIEVRVDGRLAVSPDVTGARAGLTIEQAAQAIAKKYHLNESAEQNLQGQVSNAASRGELVVRDPMTGLPYSPSTRRDFWEFVSISDLNSWLEKQGVKYRLEVVADETANVVDEAENLEAGASAGDLSHSIDRNMVMGTFPVKSEPDENVKFWKDKLGRPPKWLEDARVDPGRPGQSALWDPLQLAHCLLGRKQMNLRQLDDVMRSNYPNLFGDWKDQTADMR